MSCARCGTKEKPFLVCSRCKTAKYCGVDCQRKHWKEHKPECSPPPSKKPVPTKPAPSVKVVLLPPTEDDFESLTPVEIKFVQSVLLTMNTDEVPPASMTFAVQTRLMMDRITKFVASMAEKEHVYGSVCELTTFLYNNESGTRTVYELGMKYAHSVGLERACAHLRGEMYDEEDVSAFYGLQKKISANPMSFVVGFIKTKPEPAPDGTPCGIHSTVTCVEDVGVIEEDDLISRAVEIGRARFYTPSPEKAERFGVTLYNLPVPRLLVLNGDFRHTTRLETEQKVALARAILKAKPTLVSKIKASLKDGNRGRFCIQLTGEKGITAKWKTVTGRELNVLRWNKAVSSTLNDPINSELDMIEKLDVEENLLVSVQEEVDNRRVCFVIAQPWKNPEWLAREMQNEIASRMQQHFRDPVFD